MVTAGGICAALGFLLFSTAATPTGPGDTSPAGTTVRIEVRGADDPRWILSRVEVLLDGEPQPSAEETPDEPGPVWSGLIAPGPHTLAALLTFRPRNPDLAGQIHTVRVEGERLFPARPLRPLVLLITPVRPTPAPGSDLLHASYTFTPPPVDARTVQ